MRIRPAVSLFTRAGRAPPSHYGSKNMLYLILIIAFFGQLDKAAAIIKYKIGAADKYIQQNIK
jgi:hypothetical protein